MSSRPSLPSRSDVVETGDFSGALRDLWARWKRADIMIPEPLFARSKMITIL